MPDTSESPLESRITEKLSQLPGYTGYRQKDQRRLSDRIVRSSAARMLLDASRALESAGERFVEQREFESARVVGALAQRFAYAADKVNSRSAGYGGIFTDTPVDEAVLDRLIAYDEELLDRATELDTATAELRDKSATGAPDSSIIDLETSLSSFLGTIDDRQDLLINPIDVTAQSGGQVTPAETRSKPEWLGLEIGSALAHFDDHYLVSEIITIFGDSDAVRLTKIENQPDTWLVELEGANRTTAIGGAVSESPVQTTSSQQSWSGLATTERVNGSNAFPGVDVKTQVDGEQVSIEVTFPGSSEILRISGATTHPDDIEIFGVSEFPS